MRLLTFQLNTFVFRHGKVNFSLFLRQGNVQNERVPETSVTCCDRKKIIQVRPADVILAKQRLRFDTRSRQVSKESISPVGGEISLWVQSEKSIHKIHVGKRKLGEKSLERGNEAPLSAGKLRERWRETSSFRRG